jgi:enoyl-CoA hydratase/carnithine racemase
VGKSKAMELILTGDMMSAEEAAQYGLVAKARSTDTPLPHGAPLPRYLAASCSQSYAQVPAAYSA